MLLNKIRRWIDKLVTNSGLFTTDLSTKNVYKQVKLSYHHEIKLRDKSYVLRFNVPVNWGMDNSAAEMPSIIFVPNGQNLNTSEVFLSLMMYCADNTNKNLNVTDLSQELKINEGYTEDMELSSLLTYDKRKISALVLLNKDIKYFRTQVILSPEEDINVLIVISLQINDISENLMVTHYPIIIDLVKSLKIQPKAEDARTKMEYLISFQ